MAKEMIEDLNVACAKLEEDYWNLENGSDDSVLENIHFSLFLDRENVKKMANSIAINLRTTFETEADDFNSQQLENYGKQVLKIKKNFERTVKYKVEQAYKEIPIEAKRAEIKSNINEIGK